MLEHKQLTAADLGTIVANALRQHLDQLRVCNDPECETCRSNVDFIKQLGLYSKRGR